MWTAAACRRCGRRSLLRGLLAVVLAAATKIGFPFSEIQLKRLPTPSFSCFAPGRSFCYDARMTTSQTKIMPIPDALALRDILRQEGRCVVWTNGCYDLFHAGHVASIEFAKSQGDILFVGISSDQSVKLNKGDLRPVVDEMNRARVIAALEAVDVVVIFGEKDVTGLVKQFQPDVLVKGADRSGQVLGQEFVESYGGRVALCPVVEGLSTTSLIDKVVKAYGPGAP